MVRFLLSALISAVLFAGYADAEDRTPPEIGITERTGQQIPLDLWFYDETGSRLRLGALVDKPTILVTVYYHCHHICPQMLLGLSEVFSKLQMAPGKDYGVITLSLDESDTPEDSRNQKMNYLKAAERPFPANAWKFLTGDRENIARITDAVGVAFERRGHGFIHPEALIFLSPQGIISRYIYVSKYSYGLAYPVTFLPVDITQAIHDAANGVVADAGSKTALLCFPGEPRQQERFFSILEAAGGATLIMMAAFFLYLHITNRRKSG